MSLFPKSSSPSSRLRRALGKRNTNVRWASQGGIVQGKKDVDCLSNRTNLDYSHLRVIRETTEVNHWRMWRNSKGHLVITHALGKVGNVQVGWGRVHVRTILWAYVLKAVKRGVGIVLGKSSLGFDTRLGDSRMLRQLNVQNPAEKRHTIQVCESQLCLRGLTILNKRCRFVLKCNLHTQHITDHAKQCE